ncbi:MAG: MFS transporter [Acidimicrobiaceae bacterium]|nr:MFS transporter [Acidimicrobiaceae bacterium]
MFRIRGLGQLTISTLFSRIGTQMFAVLIVLFVLSVYHSPAFSGIVILCSQLPGILFSPIAGALLDRGAKVPLMALDYGIEATAIGLIGGLSMAGDLSRTMLLVIALLGSFTQPLSRVGARTLYPIIVPKPLWDRTNALDSGSQLTATVLGPVAAGVAVAAVGARSAMVIVAAVFFLASVALVGVRLPASGTGSDQPLLRDARDAVAYVFSNRVLRMLAGSLTLYSAAQNGVLIAVPYLVLHRIHGTSTAVGLVIAVFGIAGFAGGLAAGRMGTAGREKRIIARSCFISGAAFVVMSTAHGYLLLVATMAIIGIATAPMTVAMFSLRQRATDPAWYGRAFAVSMNLNYGLTPATAAVIGAILSHSISEAFIFMGVVAAVAGIWPAILPAAYYRPVTDHSLPATT